mmetsp:Transcript_9890/g.40075  ORF Transcript_9890/g.40075 Transcript_9890/m.40075 type:complete len:207 (-) Transcript_9890:22-642(-)
MRNQLLDALQDRVLAVRKTVPHLDDVVVLSDADCDSVDRVALFEDAGELLTAGRHAEVGPDSLRVVLLHAHGPETAVHVHGILPEGPDAELHHVEARLRPHLVHERKVVEAAPVVLHRLYCAEVVKRFLVLLCSCVAAHGLVNPKAPGFLQRHRAAHGQLLAVRLTDAVPLLNRIVLEPTGHAPQYSLDDYRDLYFGDDDWWRLPK